MDIGGKKSKSVNDPPLQLEMSRVAKNGVVVVLLNGKN